MKIDRQKTSVSSLDLKNHSVIYQSKLLNIFSSSSSTQMPFDSQIFLLKIFLFTVFTMLFTELTQAQDLVTDRPDVTESAIVVPRKNIQLEIGASTEFFSNQADVYNLPTFLFRIGFNNRFELRLGSTYSFLNSSIENRSGFNASELGLKVSLNENRDANYQHAMLIGVGVPYLVATDLRENAFTTPSIVYAFQFDISDRVGFSSNIGGIWDTENNGARITYTASFAFGLTEKLGFYAELFGYSGENGSNQLNADGGFTYLINPLMQLDASYGNSLSPNTDYKFIAIGYSWRFSVEKNKNINE